MSLFTKVRGLRPKRHLHNLSHDNLISHDLGQIVPCFVMHHALPGSKLTISYSQLSRMQALLAPIMSTVDSSVRFYKVPFRIIDSSWTRFISGEAEINNDFEYNPPYFTISGFDNEAQTQGESVEDYFFAGSLMDFLGYPVIDSYSPTFKKLSIRPLQAYLLVIKTWFLNENIIPEGSNFKDFVNYLDIFVPDTFYANQEGVLTGDMSNTLYYFLKIFKAISSSMCFPHAWGKDYYTGALPFVQVGEPVRLSMASTAPVTIGGGPTPSTGGQFVELGNSTYPPMIESINGDFSPQVLKPLIANTTVEESDTTTIDVGEVGGLTHLQGLLTTDLNGSADLSDATAISILEFRIANALQSYKELTARIGHRYNEYLEGTWNVKSRDSRLQLPERLGGGKVPVNIADIEQTSATAANQTAATGKTPLGWLAGKATAFGAQMKPIRTFIEEDCLIIGVLYTQPKSRNYCNQGINRFLTKLTDRFDFFHPKFEHIGEQAINTTELWWKAQITDVFGYQARYAEYKWWANEVHGQFNTTLDFWHLARKFSSKPTLSPEFIYVQQSEMTRPFAIQEIAGKSLQQCMSWLHFEVDYLAPMSKYGTPMLLN